MNNREWIRMTKPRMNANQRPANGASSRPFPSPNLRNLSNLRILNSPFCLYTGGLLVPLFFQAGSDQAGCFSGGLGIGGFEAAPEIGWSFARVCDRLDYGVAHQRNFLR
jgi:hypothetical protein